MPSPSEIRIERLEEEVERLKQANELLKRSIIHEAIIFPKEWRITRQEAAALRLLYRFGMVSYEAFLAALDISDPTGKHVAVVIHRLRGKLKPLGVEIYTHYSEGYRIDAIGRAKLKRLIEHEHESRAATPAGVPAYAECAV